MIIKIFLFNIVLIFYTSLGQVKELPERFEKTAANIFTAFTESVEWYDMPIAAIYLVRDKIHPEQDDKFRIPASSFEISLQKSIGRTGRFSPGSIDKDYIPFNLIYAKVAYNLAADLFTDRDITKDSYKKIILFNKALVYTHTLTELTKNLTSRSRPDEADTRSFFSGHSSTTFTAASFLYREVSDYIDEMQFVQNKNLQSVLKAASFSALYGWAGYVAYSRMRDNKHYLSDVLIGAAVGTFIGNFLYSSYFNEKNNSYDIGLNVIDKVPSFYLSIKF